MKTDIVDRIFALFDRFGDERYGEDVTQLQHALQAAHIARLGGARDNLIVAALLHDIGQFIDGAGDAVERDGTDARHEQLGARLLARHFAPAIVEPVRLHVDAKRYLAATEPTYRYSLSAASVISMAVQGGPMPEAECRRFEDHPHFADAVFLRRCDDAAKRPKWTIPSLASYRALLASREGSER